MGRYVYFMALHNEVGSDFTNPIWNRVLEGLSPSFPPPPLIAKKNWKVISVTLTLFLEQGGIPSWLLL